MTLKEKALLLATEAHDSINQKRKTGEDYIIHPLSVADIVSSITEDEEIISAAYLHDVIEDVYPKNSKYSLEYIKNEFGDRVALLVKQLTNEFTKEKYPILNRKQRKVFENARIVSISPDAKTIKLADIIDNCSSLQGLDDFGQVYLREKKEQLNFLKEGNKTLFDQAFNILNHQDLKFKN